MKSIVFALALMLVPCVSFAQQPSNNDTPTKDDNNGKDAVLSPDNTTQTLPNSTHEYHQPEFEMPKKDVLMQIMGSLWYLCHCYMTASCHT